MLENGLEKISCADVFQVLDVRGTNLASDERSVDFAYFPCYVYQKRRCFAITEQANALWRNHTEGQEDDIALHQREPAEKGLPSPLAQGDIQRAWVAGGVENESAFRQFCKQSLLMLNRASGA